MKILFEIVSSEILKIKKSKVLIGSILAFSIAPIMGAVFIIVLRDQNLMEANSAIATKAALTGFTSDWPSYFNLLAQSIGVGGVIIFGFICAWIFGREYSDKTLKDLFVLPIKRTYFIIGKLIAVSVWSLFLVLLIILLTLIFGYFLNLQGWSIDLFSSSLIKILFTTLLVLFLLTPVALIASIGKGYLAPLAFIILVIVFAQIIGALGYASYFPWAVPGIYSKIIGSNNVLDYFSYLILFSTSILSYFGTIYWWNFTDQK